MAPPTTPLRALLLGPVYTSEKVGGLPIALVDITAQLRAHGWHVDTQAGATTPAATWIVTSTYSKLAALQRWLPLFNLWRRAVPLMLRQRIAAFWQPRARYELLAHNLASVTQLLATAAQAYDVVLVCADAVPPGLLALAHARHPRVVVITLASLGEELQARWWSWARRIAALRLGAPTDPYLFRRIAADQVQLAIFASAHWRREALAAGLAAERAHTVYFGIPQPAPRPRPDQTHNRILWVGRLVPEKGLHLLLPALPTIRRALGSVSLTVIAGQGPRGYRRLIDGLIRNHGLEQAVRFVPPQQRDALQESYAAHDILFFYSPFTDPVAFVLMEAFAAGLPVVASAAGSDAMFVEPNVTCVCYEPRSQASIAAAVVALLGNAPLRHALAAQAFQRVTSAGTLAQMGAEYDRLLRAFVA